LLAARFSAPFFFCLGFLVSRVDRFCSLFATTLSLVKRAQANMLRIRADSTRNLQAARYSRFDHRLVVTSALAEVFEVLSPTSDRTDRIVKLREYHAVPTIRCYIILKHNNAGLTVFTRRHQGEDWTGRALTIEDTLQLSEIGIEIPVAEFYEHVDLPESDAAVTVLSPVE
jgi:hypothetical protein